MSENFTAPIIVHGEGLTQFTKAELAERLGALGLQVAVPALPQHERTLQEIIELHQEQSRLPVVFSESEFRSFAADDFVAAVIGRTWHQICRLGFSFPLTPRGIANGRSLQDKIAFFYPSSLLTADTVPDYDYEQGFAMWGSPNVYPELSVASQPDAVSALKLVNNGIFRDGPNIGDQCEGLLRKFCSHILGNPGG